MKILVPLFLAALSSCHVHLDWDIRDQLGVNVENGSGPTFLAKYATDDGRVTTYSVSGQSRSFPRSARDLKGGVVVSTKVTASLPYLGIEVASVDAATAEGLGIEPWVGVLVREVEDEQPAAAAGLQRGDLLLSAGEVEFQSEGEFADFVTRSLLPGDTITFLVSRSTSEFVRADMETEVLVGSRSVDETESSRIDLELEPEIVRRAGIGLMTVPSDLSGEIWGQSEPVPLVAAVVTGSPAYLAGVRAGDRVLRADGVPVQTAEEVLEIVNRADGSLDLDVDGRLGQHAARFSLESDVLGESDFEIPILVDYESRADRKHLSVLDFIFQFGFNKRSRYSVSSTRKPKKTSSLSILPLGMFEFERTPTKVTNRLFWFITWSREV